MIRPDAGVVNDRLLAGVCALCFLIKCFVCRAAGICEAVQASGPVDPAGCVQMAEEALSQPAPDLQRLLQTARHHRYLFLFLGSCTVIMADGHHRSCVSPSEVD